MLLSVLNTNIHLMFLAVSISYTCPPFIKHREKSATTSQVTHVTDLALGHDYLTPWTPDQAWPWPWPCLDLCGIHFTEFVKCWKRDILAQGAASLVPSWLFYLFFFSYELMSLRKAWAAFPPNPFPFLIAWKTWIFLISNEQGESIA